MKRVLVLDPEVGLHEFYLRAIREAFGENVTEVLFFQEIDELDRAAGEADLLLLESQPFSADYQTLFESLREWTGRGCRPVLVSGFVSERLIVEALLTGARDFVSKRNLKHGRLPLILRRAAIPEKGTENSDGSAPEGKRGELDLEIRLSLRDESLEKLRSKLVNGINPSDDSELEEGKTYEIIFLFAQLRLSESLKLRLEKRKLSLLRDKILNNYNTVAKKYGNRFGLSKEDGCFFGFGGQQYLPALLAAIEMHGQINMINFTQDYLPEPVGVTLALCRGETRFTSQIGNLTSEGLNLAAHLAIKREENYTIFLTDELYRQIGPRAARYFEDAGVFEGARIHRYNLE